MLKIQLKYLPTLGTMNNSILFQQYILSVKMNNFEASCMAPIYYMKSHVQKNITSFVCDRRFCNSIIFYTGKVSLKLLNAKINFPILRNKIPTNR